MPGLAWTLSVLLGQGLEQPEVQWDVPPGCPRETEVAEALRAYRAGHAARPGVTARAVITATVRDYTLALTIDAPEGTSELVLRDPDCEVLVDATALVVALHLDAAHVPPPPPPPPPRPTASTSSVVPRRSGASVVGGRRSIAVLVRGFGGIASGVAPGPAGALGLGLGLARSTLRGELVLAQGLARRQSSALEPAVGVAVRNWSAAARACWAPLVGRWQTLLCGDIELGAAVARGFGVDAPRMRRAVSASVGATAGLIGWVRPRVGLWLEARAHVAMTRPQFAVAGLGVIYRAPAAGVRLLAGVELRFSLAGRHRSVTNRGRGGD